MNVFALLGVDAGADERAIKRAYARKLKQTRPDEDPVAFQRLHEAYQAALQYARHRIVDEDEDDTDWHDAAQAGPTADTDATLTLRWSPGDGAASPMPLVADTLEAILAAPADTGDDTAPPRPSTAEPGAVAAEAQPAPPSLHDALHRHAFDPRALFEELLVRIGQNQTEQLADWLARHPALYDLDHKRQAGDVVRHGVESRDVALSARQAALLAQFFGIDDQAWATRATVRWQVRQEYTADHGEASPMAVRQLKRPFRWQRALLYASVPTLGPRIAALGHRLIDEYGGLPPGIDGEQHAFFVRMADPRHLGRWRWAGMALRGLAVAMFVLVSGLVFSERKAEVFAIAAAYFGGFFALEAGVLLTRLMMRWQRMPTATNVQLCAPVVLALCGLALGAAWPAADWLAYCLTGIACLVYWRRFFNLLRFCLGSWWLGALIGADRVEPTLVAFALVPLWVTAGDALYAWRRRVPLSAVDDNRWTMVLSYVVLASGLLASLVYG
ncbi:hypothetical protein [Xanthomonas sp. XNM01]|uniref:hypothetical protein n=1 Tax=Xanthomonas sp. XNM01 TaxID=2769289 RepID=UPI00177D32DE|nr:hypothetical protein [Xanthomonas sp. XNM01]MBD9369219.1 hypothetical protein [Xanthomonas sp. XNM01]